MQNLGDLLKNAGVPGTQNPAPKARDALLAELTEMSRRQHYGIQPSHVAQDRLPPDFDPLRASRDKTDFLLGLAYLLNRKPELFTKHVVFGLCQLAHTVRDGLSGGRRIRFGDDILPPLLQVKAKIKKDESANAVALLKKAFQFE